MRADSPATPTIAATYTRRWLVRGAADRIVLRAPEGRQPRDYQIAAELGCRVGEDLVLEIRARRVPARRRAGAADPR